MTSSERLDARRALLAVRSGAADCPYLELEGGGRQQITYNGPVTRY
ncbi:hypothetical protein [Nocardia sp. NPDC051981]